MKKFLCITLSLIITLSILPLNAQEVFTPVLEREDMENYNEVSATIDKERQQITIDNHEAVYEEFIQILKEKSKRAFKNLKKNSGTYSDKQTAWNMAFFPVIEKDEKYPNSKYFKEPYQLYHYALEVYYQNIITPEAQQIGLKDYRNKARQHIRQLIAQRNQGKDFFADTTINESVNPMSEAAYLVAYATHINSFYNEVREAKLAQQKCKKLNEAEFWGYSQEECILINTLAKDYDLKTIDMGRQRIGTFASIVADEMDQCLRNVLMALQTPFLPFEEVNKFLNSMGGSESAWASCGMTRKELIQIITDNTMTREEAKKSLKKGVGGKILQGLDYTSFSYWVERGDKTKEFEDYVIDNFGQDKLEELKEEGKQKEEIEIAERMAESYNAVLSAIATDLISYGKIYYYNNDVNLVGLNDENVPVNASAKFATTWYKMGTDQTQEYSPIANFARGAILQAGGKARKLQDGLLTKTMYEAKAKENVKTNIMVLSMAMDFAVDPFMVLAPLQMVKGTKLLKMGAKYAPKTTRTAYNASKATGAAVKTAKVAIKDSKAGQTVSKVVDKASQPVKQLKQKAGKVITDAADDWSDYGKYYGASRPASKGTDVVTATKKADDVTDAAKAADDVADITTPAAKTTPKKTATDPEELGPKLTDEFDETIAKAGKTEPEATTPSTRKCIGFNCKDTDYTPTNTTTGAPEGMRRRIGFSKEPEYIPDEAGKAAANGKGGVQDFTAKGNTGPQARGPEGPSAKNPYDVRNSAGNPDTPSAPQQDLSGLNQNISNTSAEPLTRDESWKIYKDRRDQTQTSANSNIRQWANRDRTYNGTVEVKFKNDRYVEITKINGQKTRVRADDFKAWLDGIPDSPANISQREREAIKGYDDFLAQHNQISTAKVKEAELAAQEGEKAKDLMARTNSVLKENSDTHNALAMSSRGFQNSIKNGCTDVKTCNNLIEYLIENRGELNQQISELHQAFIKSTGNSDVEAFYKALLDSNNTSSYIKDLLKNTGLRDFVTKGTSFPDFANIADNMLRPFEWQDLIKILKSDTPDSLKSLKQIATADDWKLVTSKSRELLGKRHAYFVEQYTDALNNIEKIAPKAVEDIRKGKVPHSVTLQRAGVDKKQAQNIAYWYNGIKQIDKVL